MNTLAVLLTCHNRRFKTISCLDSLYDCQLPSNFIFDVYLVDDGSIDGTSNAVMENFPSVHIIQGNGNLFWNQGMRLAWETASKTRNYDFYLWLNDDTILDKDGLVELINSHKETVVKKNKSAVFCGACRSSDDKEEYSYGGRTDEGQIIPNGQLQPLKYMNGNVVLVPKEVFNVIGNLSSDYTHILGDIDYGLRVLGNDMQCFTTKKYIATCPPNIGIPSWCDPQKPLTIRWKLLHSPNGLNIREYLIYRKKFWGWKWIIFAIKVYIKVLTPRLYSNISKL